MCVLEGMRVRDMRKKERWLEAVAAMVSSAAHLDNDFPPGYLHENGTQLFHSQLESGEVGLMHFHLRVKTRRRKRERERVRRG